MPKNFNKMLNSIKGNLKGKINPKTKESYSESDISAIAIAQYKNKYGSAPSREQSPKWYCEDGREVRENVNLNWTEVIETSNAKPIRGEPLKINGMAINETVTANKIKYVAEELAEAAPSMIGKPLLDSHQNESVKNIMGKVIDAKKVEGGLWYEAEIDPDERVIVNKIRKGYINKVSIGAHVKELVKESVTEADGSNSDVYVAKGLTFNELSLVPVPGDANSSITITHALSESFNAQSLPEMVEETFEETKMEEKQNNELSLLKEENAKLKEELSKIDEAKKLAALKEELIKQIREELEAEKKEEEEEAPKEEEVEAKEEAPKEEEEKEKEAEAEESNESKGIVEGSESKEENSEILKIKEKLVIDRNRDGAMFYYKTE